jgi:hypothetical protein
MDSHWQYHAGVLRPDTDAAGSSNEVEVGQTKARHRIKIPMFEAWKKGVVPDLDPQEEEETQPEVKPPRILDPKLEAWKKGVVPDLEDEKVEVEETKPEVKPPRILDPKLEAWKKGVVPDLEDEDGGGKTKGGEDMIGMAL